MYMVWPRLYFPLTASGWRCGSMICSRTFGSSCLTVRRTVGEEELASIFLQRTFESRTLRSVAVINENRLTGNSTFSMKSMQNKTDCILCIGPTLLLCLLLIIFLSNQECFSCTFAHFSFVLFIK